MKIAIIGTGHVGGTLGACWSKCGYTVAYGSRDPGSERHARLLSDCGKRASVTTPAEAVQDADAVLIATPWGATRKVVESLGDLEGTVLLDATNPMQPDLDGLDILDGRSGAERIAEWAPGARVVKIFNTTGSGNMAHPIYQRQDLTMLYCGDDPMAKQMASQLAVTTGFEPIDIGPLIHARLLEQMALLWVTLAYKQGFGPDFAFQLIRR